MSGLMFVTILLNFAIAWFTCYMAGRAWVEGRAIGGYADLMIWSAAALAAAGFTMAFLPGIGFFARAYFDFSSYNPLDPPFAQRFFHIVVALAGLAISAGIYLWTRHILEKELVKLDEMARHAFIDTYEAFHQIDRLGRAVRSTSRSLTSIETANVSDLVFGSGEGASTSSSGASRDRGKISPLFLIVLALAAGVILTIVLIRYYAGAQETPVYRHIIAPLQQEEWEQERRARVARREANLAAQPVKAAGSAPPGSPD